MGAADDEEDLAGYDEEPLWGTEPLDDGTDEEQPDLCYAIARGESHTVVVGPTLRAGASSTLQRIGAWMDASPGAAKLDARQEVAVLPDAADRLVAGAAFAERPARGNDRRDYDAHQFDVWTDSIFALGLTDIIIPINLGKDPPFRGTPFLASDNWRRLQFLVQTLTAHRYPEGQSPKVHLLAYYNLNTQFIADASATFINLCARIPGISSVMLDCEEWWVGGRNYHVTANQRRQGAADVRTHLIDPWPSALRPPLGIGVTGLASSPPRDLIELLDYGVPQVYGSNENMGGEVFANATAGRQLHIAIERHHRFCASYLDAFGSGRSGRVIVGHTARRRFIPDVGRLRLMVKAALLYGASGTPAITGPDALFYWSVQHLLFRHGYRAEVARLAQLARRGGLIAENVDP